MIPVKAIVLIPGLVVCGVTSLANNGFKALMKRLNTTETINERLEKRYPGSHFINDPEDIPNWEAPK